MLKDQLLLEAREAIAQPGSAAWVRVAEACGLTIELREKHDIFCSMVVYPVIPKGMILLRLIPTAAHTFEDVDLTLEAFSTIKARLQEGAYSEMPAWS